MIEIQGDYWDKTLNFDGYVCTTNTTLKSDNRLVMGAGIAKDFAARYSHLPEEWGLAVLAGHKSVIFTPSDDGYLIALPTKYDWKLPSPEWLVIQSCKELRFVVNCLGLRRILMTRPGCGNGGLKWENIKPKLDFLDDRFTVISNG